MNILITGAAGFLGSHLAENFLKDNFTVFAVDNLCTGSQSNINYLKQIEVVKKDSKKLTFLNKDVSLSWQAWSANLPNKFEYVFHFASPASPPHYQKLGLETMWVNTVGLAHALEFADKTSARVIFASTSEIYGDPLVSPQPESYWGNVNTVGIRSCYDEAKRFGESLIYTHNLKHKTKHGFVRIFNTYGPRMNPNDGRVIINFLIQGLKSEKLTIYGDGKQTRSFCYVDDLIRAIVAYAKSQITEPVNIGNDKEFTILEAAETIQKIFAPQKLEIEFHPLPADDPKKRRPNLTKAKTLLSGWEPQIQLEDGLKRMLTHLRQEQNF